MRIAGTEARAARDAYDFSQEAGFFRRNLWARLCALDNRPRELSEDELSDVNAAGAPEYGRKPDKPLN